MPLSTYAATAPDGRIKIVYADSRDQAIERGTKMLGTKPKSVRKIRKGL